ncbi:MAG: SpoIID/LytB domain-containing protein [Parachlamydiaceae bacterium]
MILKNLICTMTLAGALCAQALNAGIVDLVSSAFAVQTPVEPPEVRVLLVHDQPDVILEVKGNYKIYDPNTNERIAIGVGGKRRHIQALADGLRWGEEFPGVHQIAIVPENLATTIIVDGIEYQGAIYVYDVGGSISVVNKLDVEHYLNIVLPQRYPELVQEEVLAAVAITARTFNYSNLEKRKKAYWDLDAQTEGYHGIALNKDSKAFEAALYKTRYIAMENAESAVFSASWRASTNDKRYQGVTYSSITLPEAEILARAGQNAMSILKKAFPDATLELLFPPATKS